MTSAVASNLIPAAAPPAAAVLPSSSSSSSSYGWLGPRASFSRDAASVAQEAAAAAVSSSAAAAVAVTVATTLEPAISKDFIDFEFSFGGCATMLPADELFADGKLLPLRKAAAAAAVPEHQAQQQPEAAAAPPPTRSETMPAPPAERVKPPRAAATDAAADPYVFSPRAPSCSSRWRELLGLKRAAAGAQSPRPSPSPSPAAAPAKTPGRTANSSAARSLKFLLQRSNNHGGRASGAAASDLASAPLLRDSSDSEASLSLASSRFSLSSSSSSSGHDHDEIPRLSLDSADPNPPRLRLVRSSHRHSTSSSRSPARRRRPSPPPPPRCLSVDSPRMNSSGKIVFQSLERSCSSPCSLHAASKARARAVDRSYSSGVRVAPVVLNVPVCSRPVFGFFKDKKESAAKDSSAARSTRSSTLGRKPTPPQPQRWSGELPKLSG